MSQGVFQATIRCLSRMNWCSYYPCIEAMDPVENSQFLMGIYAQISTSDPDFSAVKRPIYRALQ